MAAGRIREVRRCQLREIGPRVGAQATDGGLGFFVAVLLRMHPAAPPGFPLGGGNDVGIGGWCSSPPLDARPRIKCGAGCTGMTGVEWLDEQRSKDEGYDSHELYQDIEGRSAGVLERVAHCIANHGGVVRL